MEKKENKTLLTDWYEYTMCQTYFDQGMQNDIVYFDVFFRKNPFEGGYTITGGLDNIIDFILNINHSKEDIDYLREKGNFSEEYLEYLSNLKFTGDIYAVPDGTPLFPNEAAITIKAPLIEAQLIETAILTNFNHGTLVATAAKRIVNEANGIPVMEFGARRGRGEESCIEASKYAYIAGCSGTSNTLAGKKYDIPVVGTMAHSLIQAFDTEYEAFLAYAKSNPNNCMFLVDTYDTLKSGIPNAIRVAKEYLEPNGYKFKGIRIDSGDLIYLSKAARQLLDEAGFTDTKICLTNGLNEYSIKNYIDKGAVIDSIGAGDNIIAPKERVGGVYKLVAKEKDGKIIPKIKVSEDTIKTTNPGYKKIYRFYDNDTHKVLGDVIATHDEIINEDKYTLISDRDPWKRTSIEDYYVRELQKPIFKDGKLVYKVPTLLESRMYCDSEFEKLTDRITDVTEPHTYYVDLSEQEKQLKEYLLFETTKSAAQTAIDNNGYAKKIGAK